MVPVKSWKNLSPFGSIWYWCSKNNDKIQRDQPSKVSQVHQLTKLLFHCISEPSADTLCHAQSHIPCTKNIIYTNSKLTCACKLEVSLRRGGGGGGGKTQEFFIWEGSPPRSKPLSFYKPFLTERYSFRTPSIDKWNPFYIPCLQLYTLFKIHCLLNMNKSHNQNVLSTFSQVHLLNLFGRFYGFLQIEMIDFSTLLYTSFSEMTTLSCI